MLKVALTGGLCCGKSTVAAELLRLGCPVLDADRIGHCFLIPGNPAVTAIVQSFGPSILNDAGEIDRALLAARVFGPTPAAADDRRRLNQILHPRIMQAVHEELAGLQRQGHSLAVVEAALFVEEGLHTQFDRMVVVTCRQEQKIQRYQARTGRTREEALARIHAQMPDDVKARMADYVIDNSGSLEDLRRQVEDLYSVLRAQASPTSW